MTDSPYQLDPFTQVVNVQFGGGWFGVVGPQVGLVGTSETISSAVDFPDQQAGTPGFTPLLEYNSGGSGIIKFDTYVKNTGAPYTVTNADLTAQLRTRAGATVTGFAIAQLDARGSVGMFFKLDRFMPSSPFHVRVSFPGSVGGVAQQFAVLTLKTGVMKAGLVISSSFGLQTQAYLVAHMTNPAIPHNVLINPSTLTLEDAGGG